MRVINRVITMKKLPESATVEQKTAVLIQLAGKVPASEIARITGWKYNSVTKKAFLLKISLRCDESEKLRTKRRLEAIEASQKKQAERNSIIDNKADVLWKIPKLPKSVAMQMSNFTQAEGVYGAAL